MIHSDQLNELAKALAAFQAEVPAIPKANENPFFHSKYSDLKDAVATASPIATKHGLCVSQHPGSNERGDTLDTILLHTSGQFIESQMDLHAIKPDPQGQGSALTYARRYAYMAALGLVSSESEDDDGNAASRPNGSVAQATPAVQTLDLSKDVQALTQPQRKQLRIAWDAALPGVRTDAVPVDKNELVLSLIDAAKAEFTPEEMPF